MSLRRMLRRASGFLILGICMQFASVLLQGGLSAQTAPQAGPKTGDGSAVSAQDKQKLAARAIKLPLFFEANQGQADPSVRFLTRSGGYTMFLTPTETVLVERKNGAVSGEKFGRGFAAVRSDAKNSKQSVLRMELLGANPAPEFQGLQELPGKVNYLIGKNEAAWHTNVALFSEVQVAKVYPGVDLLFHGDQRQLEYDFIVAPGADPRRIGFKVRGANKIEIDATGNLILRTADSEFEMRKPLIYQGEGASRSEVRGKFVLSAKNQVRFELGPYDHSEKLVIDPAIDYATFLGGAGDETSEALAVDSSTPGAPKIYTTGWTTDSTSFPEGGTRINNSTATNNLYVAEIDATKTGSVSLVYLTFIGGGTAFQSAGLPTCGTVAVWLALDESHQGGSPVEPVIGGLTSCADYPNSTFITPNVTGTGADAVAALVTRLASTGTSIDTSVLLGGNGLMEVPYVFVDASGNVLVSGGSASTNLPATTGAYVSTFNNGTTGAFEDCYTTKLQRSGLTPVYFSYLNVGARSVAGQQEITCGGVIDSNNPNILYLGGNTFSAVAFAGAPASALGFQPTFQGTKDAFLMKLDSSVSGLPALQYATYVGGGGTTEVNTGAHQLGTGMAVLAGATTSNGTTNAPNIPLANSLQGGTANAAAGTTGGQTGFLTVMDTTKSGSASLISGSYFGGSSGNDAIRALGYDALIPNGFYIVAGGQTGSTDFPTLHPFQAALSGTQDGFIAAFFITPTTAVMEFSSYIGGGTDDQVSGVDIDSNHAIYATASTLAAGFFGNTNPATTVNGFQTTCMSCNIAGADLEDATVFALTSAASATFTAQILANTTTLAVGRTEQLNALATFNDGTFQDLTSKVTWLSSNPSAATISSSGLVSAVGAGMTTTISATLPGATIPSITITVPAATGFTFQLVLEGTAFGTVMDNQGQINCTNSGGQGATGTCSTTYASGTPIILTETPDSGSVFGGWGLSECTGTTQACAFTITGDTEISATFNNGTGNFALNVIPGANATGGGTVTGNIGGTGTVIQCALNGVTTPTGVCTQNILSGSITTLTAIANGTSNFTSWSAPCVVPTGQPAKCVVTMGAAQTVSALFTAQTSSFTVALTGNGTLTSISTPTVTPEIDCANPAPPTACSANFTAGTSVSLTATPATGYLFNSWTAGPCNGTTANPCAFVVGNTASTSATALFVPNTFLLTVNRAGVAGGTVTSNSVNPQAGSISCGPAAGVQGCSVNASFHTAVTLTESAPQGATFSGWSATPTACVVVGANCTFNMPAGPETVTATFTTTAAAGAVLTISKSHVGDFAQGDAGDNYTVTVLNTAGAGATNGTVTVTDTVPSGLTLDSMAGTGWTCAADSNTCTRSDVLAAGASYPAITVTVDVAEDATTPQVNSVTVSGAGSASATATDSTRILGGVSTQLITADFNVNGEGDEDKQRVDGTSKPLQVTLTNTSSTQTVHISGVTPTAPYTATTDCGALAPGGACHVFISFKPASVCQDLMDQILTVNDDDPGGNFVMTIHGWGADSVIKVDDLTDSTLTPAALAQSLVGAGVAISNVKYTGALRAAGTFTSSSNILGFTSGIVLSSGSARNVAGTNCKNGMSVDNGEPGDADLNTIVGEGSTTNDAAVLEFDFVPTSSTISFQYVFGSEEYPDFIGSFNDVFGFFLTAPGGAPVNLALIPGTDQAVSINNVNDGNGPGVPAVNPQFYVNNQVQFAPPPAPLPPVDTELNGLTVVLGAQATVTPGLTYHIKLAVADAIDFALDSNVFVQAGSLSSANVTANPTSLSFGNQAQGTTSASQPVVIVNVGASLVTISSVVASANFGETDSCPATLVAGNTEGSSCVLNVTFTPTVTGTLTGTVTVTYTNAGSQTPQTTTITLTGTGTAGAGGTISIAPTTLTFGSQAVGTTSATQTVTVSNIGGTAVTFTSIATSGDFAGAALAQCPSLAVEATPCAFQIAFKPTATGTRTGAITFTDNATGSPQTVTLTGTGTPGTATLTVTPSSLAFGSQALTTTSAPLSVTVMNTSSGAVNFTGFTTSGPDAEDFGVPLPNTSGGCSPTGTLAAGASCTINVLFTPQANGARTATLLIADNATGSPQTVALSGTGVTSSVIISIAPGGSNTATTVSGGTAVYGLTIAGAPGVTGTVQLGCVPSSVLITCNVIPASVTLNGGTTEVAFAIQTFCQGATTSTGFVAPVGGIGGGLGLLLVSLIFGGAMWMFRGNRRVALTFATLLLVALGSAACSNSLPQGPNGATPAGTYTLSLTTTLNGQTQTLNNFLTLVVK
jgi:hypothetical protein